MLLLEGLVDGIASGLTSRCGSTKTPSSFVQKSSVPCCASGLGYGRPVNVASLSAPVGPPSSQRNGHSSRTIPVAPVAGSHEDRLLLVGEGDGLLLGFEGERAADLGAEREPPSPAREDRIEGGEGRGGAERLGTDGGTCSHSHALSLSA